MVNCGLKDNVKILKAICEEKAIEIAEIEKWFEINPEIFKENPIQFKNKILSLHNNKISYHKQPCET